VKNAKKAITPFKVIQGHRGQYQSKPVCNFLFVVNSADNLSGTVAELSHLIVQLWTLCVFEPPFGGSLGTMYDVHLGLIGKRLVDFLLVVIELFR